MSAPARSIEPGLKSGEKELGSLFPLNAIHSIQQKLLEDPQECNDSRQKQITTVSPFPYFRQRKKRKEIGKKSENLDTKDRHLF